MTIGEKIKKLRKDNGITQEKLAEYLNISYQAISKWENGSAMPDITLVIPIANFFNVSTDVLFDLDSKAREEELSLISEEGRRLANLGLVREELELWRNASKKYPKDYKYLTMLAYSLYTYAGSCFENQNTEYLQEAESICNRILEDCTDNEYRSCAAQLLVLMYGEGPLKNEEKAVSAASKASYISVSREVLMTFAYSGDERIKHKHRLNLILIDLLLNSIVCEKYGSAEENIKAYESALKIYQLLFEDETFCFIIAESREYIRSLPEIIVKAKIKQR